MAAPDDEVTRIEGVTCIGQSQLAIRVRLLTGRTVWIPQSVVHDDSEVFKLGTEGELVVATWFAEREELA